MKGIFPWSDAILGELPSRRSVWCMEVNSDTRFFDFDRCPERVHGVFLMQLELRATVANEAGDDIFGR